MANHKSAIKRARQGEEQRVRNRSRKTRMNAPVEMTAGGAEGEAGAAAEDSGGGGGWRAGARRRSTTWLGVWQGNGTTIGRAGTEHDPGRDHIRVDGELLKGPELRRYYLLNKPRGDVTTLDDPQKRPTVMD